MEKRARSGAGRNGRYMANHRQLRSGQVPLCPATQTESSRCRPERAGTIYRAPTKGIEAGGWGANRAAADRPSCGGQASGAASNRLLIRCYSLVRNDVDSILTTYRHTAKGLSYQHCDSVAGLER